MAFRQIDQTKVFSEKNLRKLPGTNSHELLSERANTSGPGCSKLTTLLVNVLLKFQTLISQICQYFLLKNVRSFCIAKASLTFSIKNIGVFGYKVVKHVTSWPLNELVKLRMLWTTGPRCQKLTDIVLILPFAIKQREDLLGLALVRHKRRSVRDYILCPD